VINKLPRWVWAGGAALAFIAGSINAVGLLDFRHQAITHMTGTTTLLGIAAAQSSATDFLQLALVVLAFFGGAALSGAIIGASALQFGRRYGVVLSIESVLLFCAVPLLQQQNDLGLYLATCACGLQNAMASTYSGAVLRTTHMSGIVTDLGIFLGQRLRGHAIDVKRVRLYTLLYCAFLLGGIAGACGFSKFGVAMLYAPALLVGIAGITYAAYRHRNS
jgi:uncharacterized membrane protein YoaK (UPF0700 family)